ncbi:alcohol dehydrogenase [Gammaproteobacteria bacterium LSUCC0057]|uniref:Alcohol dehydrogenase n=1 Tax=Gammaproteobacteria bacterium LSUCC0057 TaxID=2559237 RepID=A0A4Y8UPS4_9GAMM|nr:alcohol dehydrogenase [Gammaproteobacteria bacterium LSUCC0057]
MSKIKPIDNAGLEYESTDLRLVIYADNQICDGKPSYVAPQLKLERYTPKLLSDHEVRVRMVCVGICGTDIHLMTTQGSDRKIVLSAPMEIPLAGRVIGHEGIGKVEAVGSQISQFAPGDWVVPASIWNCGQCQPCLTGLENQCEISRLLGLEFDGLFANTADLPPSMLLKVSDAVGGPDDVVALSALEPVATALQACDKTQMHEHSRVLIFGGGPIGAYAAMLARCSYSCQKIDLVEPIDKRRQLVASWCDEVYSPGQFAQSDQYYDVMIEASGDVDNINRHFLKMAAGGHIAVLGRCGRSLSIDHVDHMITNGITVQGCRGQLGGYMQKALELYKSGSLPIASLISEVVAGPAPLERLQQILIAGGYGQAAQCKRVLVLDAASLRF